MYIQFNQRGICIYLFATIESISKHKSSHNNKQVKESKQQQEELGRENTHDYIRKNERIHYIDDYQ